MLKALSEIHSPTSVSHPLGLKGRFLPAASNAHWHFTAGVQDVPTI